MAILLDVAQLIRKEHIRTMDIDIDAIIKALTEDEVKHAKELASFIEQQIDAKLKAKDVVVNQYHGIDANISFCTVTSDLKNHIQTLADETGIKSTAFTFLIEMIISREYKNVGWGSAIILHNPIVKHNDKIEAKVLLFP